MKQDDSKKPYCEIGVNYMKSVECEGCMIKKSCLREYKRRIHREKLSGFLNNDFGDDNND